MQTRADTRSERARAHLTTSAEVTRQTGEVCLDAILKAADVITEALRAGGKVLLCGNGGSAADCQHLAGEFMNRLTKDFDRPGMAVLALTTDTSFLTAFANDSGFDGVFERQVRALGRPGDVLMGISTSGKSRNVIRAVEAANGLKMTTIALTGRGGRLGEAASVVIAVPSADTQHIQEAHLSIEHAICDLVERGIWRDGPGARGDAR
jgi:D-sedoheptulose 7-phosphate isomerase